MRFFSIILLTILFSGTSYCFQTKTYNYFTRWKQNVEERQIEKLKELKVEYRERYAAFYKGDGSLPEKLTLVEELGFDKEGNLFERVIFDSYGGVKSKYDFIYSSDNDLVSEELSNQSGNILHRKEIKYNQNRDTLEVNFTSQRKLRNSKRLFNYDEHGKLASKIFYDSKDVVYLREEYTYKNNNLDMLEFYTINNTVHSRVRFEYNSKGDIVKEIQDGIEKFHYYDEKGRLTKVESRDTKRIYEYDENDNIIEDQFFIEKDKRQFRFTYKYTPEGLLSEFIRYDAKDVKMSYTKFEYTFFE